MVNWTTGSRIRRRPLNIAHRGASSVAPANTLPAFEKALELGADGVEFDVHLSADDQPVVIHDFTLDDTTDSQGRVADMTLAQLQELDAGSAFDPAFAGESIPSLDQVLEAVGHRLLLNIELKTTRLRGDGLERSVVTAVERHGLSGAQVLVSSFNPLALRRVKQIAPHLPVGLLYSPDLPLPLRRAWLAPLCPHEARHPAHTMVDARYMAWARRRGYQVNTWTVDDPDEMHRLVSLGVDGVITNRPDVLRAILASGLEPGEPL